LQQCIKIFSLYLNREIRFDCLRKLDGVALNGLSGVWGVCINFFL